MDMIKIGKFLAEKRKENNLTQLELAEKLNMTDRAISKWECGKSMPDSSIMLELCSILGISVNELLTGEEIKMEEYKERAELNLTELKRQKEESDKRLLNAEVFLGLYTSLLFFALIFTASFVEMADWLRIVLIATGLAFFAIGVHICLKIEQKAGVIEINPKKKTHLTDVRRVLITFAILSGMILLIIVIMLIFRANIIKRRRNESTRRANML